MTIKELTNVFKGKASVDRATITGKMLGGYSMKIETLYDGNLGKLTDENLLNAEIKAIVNIPGSTKQGGIPFLKITIK